MRALRPDDLIRPRCRLGHAVAVKRRTGSTNDDARALAEAGAAEGVTVLAEEQEMGRGRLDRRWLSEPGKNLLFSIILRPAGLDRPGLITLAAGVGICAALTAEGIDAHIKWPNDIRAGGKKLAGILCEAGQPARRGRKAPSIDPGPFVILGIGLNVNQLLFDPALAATSAAIELGHSLRRPPLYRHALAELERALALAATDPQALLDEWMERAECRGRRVRAEMPTEVIEGEAVGVNEDGALLVRDDSGIVNTVVAGDVIELKR